MIIRETEYIKNKSETLFEDVLTILINRGSMPYVSHCRWVQTNLLWYRLLLISIFILYIKMLMNIEWWYCVVPNTVILDKRLTPTQKILYCIINSLCIETWYYRVTNKCLWDILWLGKRSISNCIRKLVECWYISTKWKNEQRVIVLNMTLQWYKE